MTTFNLRHPDEALNTSQLRSLLALDSDWLTREREALRTLVDADNSAEKIRMERQSQRETHERTPSQIRWKPCKPPTGKSQPIWTPLNAAAPRWNWPCVRTTTPRQNRGPATREPPAGGENASLGAFCMS